MTALLTADEAAALHVGLNVIVRAGDRCPNREWIGGTEKVCSTCGGGGFIAPHAWVALTGPCPTCEGSGCNIDFCRDCGDEYGDPCERHSDHEHNVSDDNCCPDCRDGRWIVPLYAECPTCGGAGSYRGARFNIKCKTCETDDGPLGIGRVLVGRGSIEVVPVVAMTQVTRYPCITVNLEANEPDALFERSPDDHGQFDRLVIDPLPVPGRDFGIVIDCVEVA